MNAIRQVTLEATQDCRPVEQRRPAEQHCVEQAAASIQRDVPTARITGGRLITSVSHWLELHKITLLRISMGAVIFGFGVLKYFPQVSPAESLVLATTHLLTFRLIPDPIAMILFATVECIIGLSLMLGRGLRVTRYLLVLLTLSMLSPAVLLSERLFMGPYHAPTLEGQYVLKDVILFTASLVIATTLSYGKKDGEHQPAPSPDEGR